MNVSKFLASSVAAVSVVGAIGLAYAQTTPNSSTGPITVPPAQGQATTPVEPTTPVQLTTPLPATTPAQTTTPAATPTTPAQPMPDSTINSTVTTPPDAGAMSTERAAQVDRN